MYVFGHSHKVGVLHRHVVALLYEAVFRIEITTWTNDSLSASRLVNAGGSFWPETFLTCVKDDCILEMLVSWLIHRTRPFNFAFTFLI